MPRGGMREMNVDSLRQPRHNQIYVVKYNTMLFTNFPTKVEPQTNAHHLQIYLLEAGTKAAQLVLM